MDAVFTPVNQSTLERPLEGKTVAVSGRLLSLTRREVVELIEVQGGRYSARVSRQTSALVLGQNGQKTREYQQAQNLQKQGEPIEVFPEDEFLDRCGRREVSASEGRYTLGELVKFVGVPRDRLRGWIRAKLIQPIERVGTVAYFSFSEVTAVKLLCELSQAGVSTARLGRCLSQIERWMPNARQHVSRLGLDAGKLIVWRKDGMPAEVSGQLLFDFHGGEEPVSVSWSQTAQNQVAFESDGEGEDLFARGFRLEEAGEFAEAAAVYGRWLLENGPTPPVCFNLANVLMALGRLEAAIERYRQAVELDPLFAEAWNNLGDALEEAGEPHSAIIAWRYAVQADPTCADALYNLADALQNSGQTDEARRYWRAYLKSDRESIWASYAQSCLAGG